MEIQEYKKNEWVIMNGTIPLGTIQKIPGDRCNRTEFRAYAIPKGMVPADLLGRFYGRTGKTQAATKILMNAGKGNWLGGA